MTNALYEGIDKQLAAKAAEIAALRKALDLAWAWMDDAELAFLWGDRQSDRMRGMMAEARHAKDVAIAILTSRT